MIISGQARVSEFVAQSLCHSAGELLKVCCNAAENLTIWLCASFMVFALEVFSAHCVEGN